MASEYEKLRLQNLEDNKKILAELGLLNPFEPLPRVIKKAPKRKRVVEPKKKPSVEYVVNTGDGAALDIEGYGSVTEGTRRKSSRLSGHTALSYSDIEKQVEKWAAEECEEGEGDAPRRSSLIKRPMVYGPIPGVEVGTVWPMRIDCNGAGIHRPTVAGIHGGPEGAYSIVLSGGYEDNIDLGTCFTYTGEGGRDLKGTANNPKNLRTAAQSKDQSLSKGNDGLVKSVETKMAVRVIRGFKLQSPFAPEDGYRYDGLYNVEKWWYTMGLAGYGVYKFALKRLEDQAPPPWTLEGDEVRLSQASQDSGIGDDAEGDSQVTSSQHSAKSDESQLTEESKTPSETHIEKQKANKEENGGGNDTKKSERIEDTGDNSKTEKNCGEEELPVCDQVTSSQDKQNAESSPVKKGKKSKKVIDSGKKKEEPSTATTTSSQEESMDESMEGKENAESSSVKKSKKSKKVIDSEKKKEEPSTATTTSSQEESMDESMEGKENAESSSIKKSKKSKKVIDSEKKKEEPSTATTTSSQEESMDESMEGKENAESSSVKKGKKSKSKKTDGSEKKKVLKEDAKTPQRNTLFKYFNKA